MVNDYYSYFKRHRQSKNPVETSWKKCVVQNVTQLFLLRHLQSLLCTIIQKPHVISHIHLAGLRSLNGFWEDWPLFRAGPVKRYLAGDWMHHLSITAYPLPLPYDVLGERRRTNTFLRLRMSVEDSCRLCKENLRIKGTLSNTKKIFPLRRLPNEKSVNERLMALGLTLSNDNSRSGRICRSCFRLVVRIEEDLVVFRRWKEAEKESVPEASSSSVEGRPPGEEVSLAISGVHSMCPAEVSLAISGVHSVCPVRGEKRAREHSPSETCNCVNKKLCTETLTPKLAKPTAEMPVRQSLTEVRLCISCRWINVVM